MSNQISTGALQAKLRSSCNACGAAKLKCDRQQPSCERCRFSGIPCVYGISRKNARQSRATNSPLITTRRDRTKCTNCYGDDCGQPNSDLEMRTQTINYEQNVPLEYRLAPPPVTSAFQNTKQQCTNYNDILDSTGVEMSALQPYENQVGYMNLDTNWFCQNDSSISPIYTQPTQNSYKNDTTGSKTTHVRCVSNEGNSCDREAHDILGRLMLAKLADAHPTSQSASISATPAACAPLDRILNLNRESCDRLSVLLRCPCTRSTRLVLIYPAVIHQILLLYEEAARDGNGSTSAVIHPMQSIASSESFTDFTPLTSLSPWSKLHGSCTSSMSANGCISDDDHNTMHTVPSIKFTLGSFIVDDESLQALLRLRLVLSEVKKIGQLIDLIGPDSSKRIIEDAQSRTDDMQGSIFS
jgi:hypothetical protein